MRADVSSVLTAIAACVLALTATGALVFAALAWRGQRRQLAVQIRRLAAQESHLEVLAEQLNLTRDDSRHLRAPVLHARISSVGPGAQHFRLDVRLISAEPLCRLRVSIAETAPYECPLGFTPGQKGIDPRPAPDTLPAGWRVDVLRHEAVWDQPLLPGGAAGWEMEYRGKNSGRSSGSADIRLRAECTGVHGPQPWHAPLPVALTEDAQRALRFLTSLDSGQAAGQASADGPSSDGSRRGGFPARKAGSRRPAPERVPPVAPPA